MADEQDLLARVRAFDVAALAEVYDTFSPAIYRYAMRLLDDVALAEDCVTDTFGRLLDAIQTGDGPTHHLKAYLYRTAHNWITDHYRSAPRQLVSLDALSDDSGVEIPSEDELPIQAVMEQIEAQQVRLALLQLTGDQRQVIMLKFYENLSNEEVAVTINKPVGAVKSLQHRALSALRRVLAHVIEVETSS